MAAIDDVLAETGGGEVTQVLRVLELDDGLAVDLEVLEHPDDPSRRVVSRCAVELDAGRRIRDVTRHPDR